MEQYQTLQQGGNNRAEDVRKLQQTLYDKGYTQVGNIDGIYGPKTAAAVKAYQTANQLQVDGIAGKETLSHLYQTKLAPEAEVPQAAPVQTPEPTPTAEEQVPSEWGRIKQEYNENISSINKRKEEYSTQLNDYQILPYNINEDALFAQYADQYQRGGALAMQDTMGRAAALTGGYGSSYAQSVGQQAYQQYMSGLADVIPVLEQKAYDRQRQGREDILEQLALLWQEEAMENERFAIAADEYWREEDRRQEREDSDRQREQAQTETNRANLISLISIGYNPTDEELTNAGMTRAQADAILKNYNASQVRYTGGGSGGSGSGGSGSENTSTPTVTTTSGFSGTTYREAVLYLEDNDAIGLGWETLLPEYKWKQARTAYTETGEGDGTRVAAHDNYTDYVRSFVADKMEMRSLELKQEQFRGSTYSEAQSFLKKKGIQAQVMTKEQWERERAEYIRTGNGAEFVTEHSNYEEYLQYYVAFVVDANG